MRIQAAILAALLLVGASAWAADRRPRVPPDECSRRVTECEKQCDPKTGMDRLNCKTDCRLAETECRNKGRK